MDFVKNAWYVAGWGSEFDQQLLKVKILDEDLVMYRTSAGFVTALLDRCPHKLLPLSMGQLIDDNIQCGYHGTTFDAAGKCTHIPGQPRVPPTACVRVYPVYERHDIVWVWMGDPENANTDVVFDLPQMSDPAWDNHQGDALHIKSSYINVAENLVDPAHVTYVHPTTLGSASHADVPVEYQTKGDPILAYRWIRNAPPIPFFQEYGGFEGNVDRWQYFYLHLPSTAVIDFGSADADPGSTEDRRDEGIRVFALHFLTPVSGNYTIDRWMHIRNTKVKDEATAQKMDEMFRVAFSEDKDILEAVQTEEEKPQNGIQLQLAIDQACIAYRARIKEMSEAELDT
tara:strand:- start:4251 stop:5276 length:1026 start_codon:yes stop_codon:yes gene_type:complete